MTTDESERLAAVRRLDRTVGGVHGFIYFHPTAAASHEQLGLEGRAGYFASRAAPLGEVDADVVIETFYNFHPDLVRAAIPSAWATASAEAVQAARWADAAAVVATAVVGSADDPDTPTVDPARVIDRLAPVVHRLDTTDRPLAEANRGIGRPDDEAAGLWQLITVLREWRGDAHVVELRRHGIGPLDCLVLHVGSGAFTRRLAQQTRAWSDREWDDALVRLSDDGLVDGDGSLTPASIERREAVELATDRAAAHMWRDLDDHELDELRAELAALRRIIWRDSDLAVPT